MNIEPSGNNLAAPVVELCQSMTSIEPVMAIISDGLRLVDKDWRIICANPSFIKLCGLSEGEVLGHKCYEVLATPYCHTTYCYLHQALKGNVVIPTELVVARSDGEKIPVLLSVAPIKGTSGELIALAEAFRDVSELRQTEKGLRRPEESYRSLIELADKRGEAVVMLQDIANKEAALTFVGERFLEITGYQREELLGTSFFDLVSPEDRAASKLRHRQKMAGKTVPGLFELTLIAKGNRQVAIELVSSSTSYQGRMINVAYMRDVTQRKQMEHDLISYQRHLEEMVAERTKELQETNLVLEEEISRRRKVEDSLKQEIARRAEFTRALAHELKTPLTPLLGASEMLRQELTTEPLASLVKSVYQGALHLDRRVDELLDLARGEVGMLKLRRQEVAPKELLQGIVQYVSAEGARLHHEVRLDVPPDLPVVAADEDRLREVILNLLSNALKFTPAGGVITVKAHADHEELVIEVEDDGPGIPLEKGEHIFQPYFSRGDQTEHLGGLGLGLALSKMLVELHHGRIWARNRPGGGANFGFSIPLTSPGEDA